MAEEKILTRHPQGKTGRKISRKSYDLMRGAILAALKGKQLSHTELFDDVSKRLARKFEGNINWYAETVKLDLEARKEIERTSTRPEKYRLK